jgi:hypothetical protein
VDINTTGLRIQVSSENIHPSSLGHQSRSGSSSFKELGTDEGYQVGSFGC